MNIPKEGTWLIAVSTGPDSMALLNMCMEEKISCVVAHVNYHVRAQAEEEEEYIKDFCTNHKIKLHVLDEPFIYEGNFEASAREYRYSFFERLIKEYGYEGVLVAHHQDDLIETYYMQKEKNLIPKTYGLAYENTYHGIRILRPLLHYTKEELIQYCVDNGVHYYMDESNESTQYIRNKIRKELKEILTPQKRQEILQEIKEENQKLEELRFNAKKYIHNNRVDIEKYRECESSLRYTILRTLIEPKDNHYSLKHLQSIDQIILEKCDFVIEAHDQYLVQENKEMFMVRDLESYDITFLSVEELFNSNHKHFYIKEGELGVNAVSLQEEDFPITIRNVRDKDKIQMRFGTKIVHRFFIDRHKPLYLRKVWPVMVNKKGSVILVPGLGCDINHYSINPTCSVIQYTNSEGD